MSAEPRTRVYALVVVGEAVVIFVLAAMLLLGFGEPNLGEFEPISAAESGARTPANDTAITSPAIGDTRQPYATDASGQQGHDSTPARVPVQQQDQYAPDDPIGLVLYGVVFDSDSKPLKSASMRLTSLESGRALNARLYKDSGYAVAGLRPGPWRLLVTTNGYRPLRRTIQLTPSPARLRLDLYMQSATTVEIAVRTPDGKPLRTEIRNKGIKRVNTLVQAFAEHPGTRFPASLAGVNSSRNDRARWSSRKTRAEADGSLEILIELPCFVALLLGDAVLDCKLVAGGEELVTLTASLERIQAALGSILVNVAAPDGASLARVSVRAGNASSYKRAPTSGGPHRLKHVRPGFHKLAVTAQGRGSVYRWVRVQSGNELKVSVLLQGEGKIEGQVLGPDGPFGGVSIRLYPLDPRVPTTQWFSARTSKKGQFKLSRVAPGDYQLVAYHSSKQLYAVSAINVRPGRNILAPVMVSGAGKLVVEASGLPSGERPHVRIRDSRGRVLYRVSISLYGTTLLLPPGSHAYEILDRNDQVVQAGTVVIGTEPAVLHVR